jgi:SOS-response transcriptional repressor LexA
MSVQYGMAEREARTYRFIRAWQATKGYCPSLQEIADGIGYRSKTAVHNAVKELQRRGFVAKQRAKRSIVLTTEGYRVILAPDLAMRLESHAQATGDPPEAVIADAVALHLDSFDQAVSLSESLPG